MTTHPLPAPPGIAESWEEQYCQLQYLLETLEDVQYAVVVTYFGDEYAPFNTPTIEGPFINKAVADEYLTSTYTPHQLQSKDYEIVGCVLDIQLKDRHYGLYSIPGTYEPR